MRLLWLVHAPWDALEGQREYHLINHLKERCEVHIVSWASNVRHSRYYYLRPDRALSCIAPRSHAADGLWIHDCVRLPTPQLRPYDGSLTVMRAANQYFYQRCVRALIKQVEFDAVVFGPAHNSVGMPPPDLGPRAWFDYLDATFPELEAGYVARATGGVICASMTLQDRLGQKGIESHYVPNGLDVEAIRPSDSEAAKRELGLVGKKVVSLIGITCSRTLFFLEAIALAAEKVPDLCFLAVGRSPLIPLMRARCQQLGIDAVFAGRVPNAEVGKYFAASDVGLYPGDRDWYYDGACPIKVLEYTAAGKPVVATDLEELRRLSLPNVIRCAPEGRAFSAGIVSGFRSGAFRPSMEKFSWRGLAERFLRILKGYPLSAPECARESASLSAARSLLSGRHSSRSSLPGE